VQASPRTGETQNQNDFKRNKSPKPSKANENVKPENENNQVKNHPFYASESFEHPPVLQSQV